MRKTNFDKNTGGWVMIITVTYRIDFDLYRADAKHDISLTTTVYIYRNNILAHLQFGKNFRIRLNNRVQYSFKCDFTVLNDNYMFCKSYNREKVKHMSQSAFEKKLERFDKSQTAIEKEIIEEYAYTGKNSVTDTVKIAIVEKNGATTAEIDFSSDEQFKNFVAPVWLVRLSE